MPEPSPTASQADQMAFECVKFCTHVMDYDGEEAVACHACITRFMERLLATERTRLRPWLRHLDRCEYGLHFRDNTAMLSRVGTCTCGLGEDVG